MDKALTDAYSNLLYTFVEFVTQEKWDKINAPIKSVYGIRFKISGKKRWIAHPLFEKAVNG